MIGRLAKPWPSGHNTAGFGATRAECDAVAIVPGALVEVSGPTEPAATWQCGTAVVWRVTDGRLACKCVYVCEHQIRFDIEGMETEVAEEQEVRG